MEAMVYKDGAVSQGDVDTEFLGDVVRVRLLHQAVRMYEMNKRAGTHSTKSRGELPYRKAAMFKQKGTGRARVRHPQATQCRHGGIPHGPKPRDYSYSIPRRAKVEALRSALLSKFRDAEVAVTDSLDFSEPKTKRINALLDSVGFEGRCLIVDTNPSDNLLLSARNVRRVSVMPAAELNAYYLLLNRNLIITEDALNQLRERTNES